MANSVRTTAIVVDDDPDTVELLSEYLEMKGILVLGKGYDGKQGVELYHKLAPEIVFLDILMPNYDGIYALKEIRKINPKAKVIIITADLSLDTASKLDDMKATLLVYKPYEFDEIMTVIDTIGQPHAEQAS